MRISDIQIRDPFVVAYDKKYYLFGSTDKDIWKGPAVGFDVYISAAEQPCENSLTKFEGPFSVFRPPVDFWSDSSFWAPEIHRYADTWYMFATFKPKEGSRGTAVLKSESGGIMGPYKPWSLTVSGVSGPVTPAGWECLDGTFFEEDGRPWMVFCHEWQQAGDGEICLMPLTNDLRSQIPGAVPAILFRASDTPWTAALKGRAPGSFVTDGPFVYRAGNGTLFMLWSSFGGDGNYCTGIARSESGRLIGPWKQSGKPLYRLDGGHGMLFRGWDGVLYLTVHTPNKTPRERPVFLAVTETDDNLILNSVEDNYA